MNKLFAVRYGGDVNACDWQFPEDDAGSEDLKILAHHYAGNALALPKIIKLRAPWADVEAIQEEVFADPKKWRSKTLGKYLNLTGAEWRALKFRTIAPVDMSQEERADYSRILSNGRRLKKRRKRGVKSRADYLAANPLSRERPWEAEGIGRTTWYDRQKKARTSLAGIKISMHRPDLSEGQVWAGLSVPNPESGEWVCVCSPTQKPPLPDLSCEPFNLFDLIAAELTHLGAAA